MATMNWLELVQKDVWGLCHVPEPLRTAELCRLAVEMNGLALQYVPEPLRTAELCQEAVEQNGLALQYVPEPLREQVSAVAEARAKTLQIHGHTFSFSGQPGQVCAVEATWSPAAEDDAWRLSYSLMEANLLALYSAGVLFKGDQFDPKVVEAMATVFDAIEPAIERLDEEPAESGRSAPLERPANA